MCNKMGNLKELQRQIAQQNGAKRAAATESFKKAEEVRRKYFELKENGSQVFHREITPFVVFLEQSGIVSVINDALQIIREKWVEYTVSGMIVAKSFDEYLHDELGEEISSRKKGLMDSSSVILSTVIRHMREMRRQSLCFLQNDLSSQEWARQWPPKQAASSEAPLISPAIEAAGFSIHYDYKEQSLAPTLGRPRPRHNPRSGFILQPMKTINILAWQSPEKDEFLFTVDSPLYSPFGSYDFDHLEKTYGYIMRENIQQVETAVTERLSKQLLQDK